MIEKTNLTNLPLTDIASVSLLKKGFQNEIYRIDCKEGVYSLRVSIRKSFDDVAYEVAILERLQDLPVPKLRRGKEGFIFEVLHRPALLYEYIEGESPETFNERQLVQVGQFLAQFHSRISGFIWNKPRFAFYDLPDEKIDEYSVVAKNAQLPHLDLLPNVIDELKEYRLPELLPQGPIHVDLGPKNTLFFNGNLAAVLDFDNSFIGPFILDLGKTIMFFSSDKSTFDPLKAKILFNAYQSRRELSSEESQQLYKAIKFAFLSHVFMDYYMRALNITSGEYFDYIINDLYRSYKAFTMPQQEFDKFFGLV